MELSDFRWALYKCHCAVKLKLVNLYLLDLRRSRFISYKFGLISSNSSIFFYTFLHKNMTVHNSNLLRGFFFLFSVQKYCVLRKNVNLSKTEQYFFSHTFQL